MSTTSKKQAPAYFDADGDIRVYEIVEKLWKRKIPFLIIVVLFVLGSAVYAFMQPNIYRGETLLLSVSDEGSNASPFNEFGLVANLAGIDLNQESSNVQKAIAILESRNFIREFVSDYALAPYLLASEWDDAAGRNIIDSNFYNVETEEWIADKEPQYSLDWEVYRKFREILSISQDLTKNQITISIDWTDPVQAADWVNWLVKEINTKVKTADLLEAQNATDYLTEQISNTQLLELHRVFYGMIETQMRIAMLADVRDEYVFEVIDPAVTSEEKTSPKRLMLMLMGALVGAIAGFFYVIILEQFVIQTPNRTE